jgi:hypothetical protein
MPKFMLLYVSGAGPDWSAMSPDEVSKAEESVMAWWEPLRAAGRVVSEGMLEGAAAAKTVRRRPDGKVAVTDGPFIEAKEHIGGYAVVDVPDREAAIEIARTSPFLNAMEIRPLVEVRD